MDILSNLKYAEGSKKKRKVIGRGEGTGHGGTATRGMNGQGSRSGCKAKLNFEGGQMPLARRIPKRGFKNIFKVYFQVINLDRLQKLADANAFADGNVNAATLYKNGVLSKAAAPYKILGDGQLTVKLNIEAHAFSQTAKTKIEAVGGTTKNIEA